MNTKLYLDTSIPSAFYDSSKPVRQLMTQKWFEFDRTNYQLFVSTLTIQEVERFQNIEKRNQIIDLIVRSNCELLEITSEAVELSEIYLKNGAIPKSEPEDALHIAIATIAQIESLASWNFKHIVSVNPIRKIHELNQKNGFGIIEIGSLELFGGYKYGNNKDFETDSPIVTVLASACAGKDTRQLRLTAQVVVICT
jgi:predicted nucleic acid-binding protein